MRPERWEQVGQIFHAAAGLEPEQRTSFLNRICGADEKLRGEVESLLELEGRAGDFLGAGALEDAAKVLAEEKSPSLVGKKLRHYEVLELVQGGNMGEVYRARDAALRRQVAVKVLPLSFSQNADRLRRFKQEPLAASSLNHPNIVTIYEIGEVDHWHFMVSEFIEGETLRRRMMRARLTLAETLEVAIQIASALEAAHQVGIVHRDIKPENVIVRPDKLVKVVDFGLAKLTEPQAVLTSEDHLTVGVFETRSGIIMGTVRYMSPEQARGLSVDTRSDIWSLGVVLYEMVAGCAPFAGATDTDVMVSIIEREPLSLARHSPAVPEELQRIVSKALRKDREERYHGITDLLIDLKNLKLELDFAAKLAQSVPTELTFGATGKRNGGQSPAENTEATAGQTNPLRGTLSTSNVEYSVVEPKRHKKSAILALAILVALAVGVTYVATLMYERPKTDRGSLQTPIPLTTDPGWEGMASLSPDGSQVAFGSFGEKLDNLDIYVKLIGGGPPLRLTSDPAVDKFPDWSPDGRSIAFIRERGVKQEVLLIPALGGPERKLAEIAPDLPEEVSFYSSYLSWSADSKYLVTVDRASPEEPPGLFVLSVATGEKQRLTTPTPPALGDTNPAVSPDGRALAFVRLVATGNSQVYVLPLSEDGRATGEARRLDLPQRWVESPAWTPDGREIVYSAGQSFLGGTLWRVSVSGPDKPVSLTSLGEASHQPTASRLGHRLAYEVWTCQIDIWRAEVSGRDKSRPAVKLIASTRSDANPQYSPDGSRVAFSSDRSGNEGIWVCDADGSNPVQLTSFESHSGTPRWFPDGKRIVFDSQKDGQAEIYVIDAETQVPRRLTNEPSDDATPSVSRDGKWIYFASRRTGRWEIWRLPIEVGEAVQVTHQGGSIPFESPDGKLVYYQKTMGDSDVWQVPVAGGEEMRVLGPAGGLKFAVVADGIYFIQPGPPGYSGWLKGDSLKFFSFAKRTAEKVFDLKYWHGIGLSVSPDGRYVLFSQGDPFVQDLMLVENFR